LDEVFSPRQVYTTDFDVWKRDPWIVGFFDLGQLVLRFGW
jgi:hypothetical protein